MMLARLFARRRIAAQRQRVSSMAGLHRSNEHFGVANTLRGMVTVVIVQCGTLCLGNAPNFYEGD
jgi:hypothetical protein